MTIGVLLPRSTDYPTMGIDLLDGLRIKLNCEGVSDVRFVPENIGFGEDKKEVYAKAEKLLLQDEADIIVAYLSPVNAALLHPLLDAAGKKLIVMDTGMNFPSETPGANAVYVSLQGLHASYFSGKKAGENSDKVIMATSFYDGGYRGPWAYHRGVQDVGGAIVGNYVAHYKESEFTIAPFLEVVKNNTDISVAACFSTYLSSLFINSLHKQNGGSQQLNFHCSSFMFEEQIASSYALPAGKFYAYIPWLSGLDNPNNIIFTKEISERKSKKANIFHLLGWEAGIVAAHLLEQLQHSNASLKELLAGWSYESPRGKVTIHPDTHFAFSPLYYAEMTQTPEAGVNISILDKLEIDAAEHLRMMNDQPAGVTSGWFNHYLCT